MKNNNGFGCNGKEKDNRNVLATALAFIKAKCAPLSENNVTMSKEAPEKTEDEMVALVARLENKDAAARTNAILALGNAASRNIDMSAAVPALAKCLEDESVEVRESAAWALRRCAFKGADISAAFPALVKSLADASPVVRANAVLALGNAASGNVDMSSAVPALLKCLEDERSSVRENAADVLKQIRQGV